MTTTTPPKPVPKRRPISEEPATREPVAQPHVPERAHTAISMPHGRGPTTLFQVAFASAMSDPDIALLSRTLGLTMHMYPKLRPSPNEPGAVRLDHDSGLSLRHGGSEGRWVLEARTWGHPAPESIHDWQVLAAGAARLLDPVVTFPERLPAVASEQPVHPVGRAANKRLARIGRRIQGL
jgi:hypothetical protein